MDTIRAAVIGVGYFGSRHVDKLARLPGVKLEYVVDLDLARAEALAGQTGAKPVADFRDSMTEDDYPPDERQWKAYRSISRPSRSGKTCTAAR